MRILVTGACGFIGSHICKYFYSKGHKVTGWDINNIDTEYNFDLVNLLDEEAIQLKLKEVNPDIVIHCAGAADVSKSIDNPRMEYQWNVTITHNLMFAIHKTKMEDIRIVFLSSAGVYGNPIVLPIKENASLNPMSPYALHKLMCEDIFQYFHSNYNIDTKIVRIFSAYGEGLKKQIFWDMHLKVEKTGMLAMFGTGNESRDYINIADLVNAIYIVALRAPKEELIYNIANGEEITIRHAAECFADVSGLSREKILFSGEGKEGNPINWKADISKLNDLGYHKTVDFQLGIERYLDWIVNLKEHL